jgi:type IV pilus assembly protein PilE
MYQKCTPTISLKSLMQRRCKAFTLTELLVVLCIVGILIALAVPSLMPMISKAKSTEAQLQLKHLHTLQKTYFYTHSKYAESLDEIGYERAVLVSEGGTANYRIEIVQASPNTYKATATAIADFDGDGVFNVWSVDVNGMLKEEVKD